MYDAQHKLITEARMTKGSIQVSDSIEFKSINTGGNTAGNGGDGYFSGKISNQPVINFEPSNTAKGASVHVSAGDHVDQKASWDANASGSASGSANSNGDQSSKSGYDTSKVYADTTASQTNSLTADMQQEVMAGIGGDGGSGNAAMGGNVDFNFDSSI
jgi:hypothetical protein